MGRKAETDAYLPCLKCKALVPQYVKEIHATECHVLKLRRFSHPLISGLSLLGQTVIIGSQDLPTKKSIVKTKSNRHNTTKDKKNTSKVQKGDGAEDKKEKSPVTSNVLDVDGKSKVEEPEWLKKIFPGFHYRIVVMNELDLIRCNITAYTPVLLEHAGNSCAFIAMQDNTIRIGHVMLHQIGCMQYFPSLSTNALIWVKKIIGVKFAKQIVFSPKKPLSEEECTAMECHIKNIMLSSFPLGAPFTVTVSSVIHPHPSDVSGSCSFTVSSCIPQEESSGVIPEGDQLTEKMRRLHIDSNDSEKLSSPSQLITAENCLVSEHSSLFDGSEQCQGENSFDSGGYITIDEYNEGDSLDELKSIDKSFITSTPNKKSNSSDSNMCKSLLMSKMSENLSGKNVSPIDKSDRGINTWVRVGMNTKIVIERLLKTNSDVITQNTGKKDTYCKDSIYYSLMKIMQNKLKHSQHSGNPFLSGWSGVLLYGPPGTGKTLLVNEAASAMNVPLISLSLADVIGSSGGGSDCVRHRFRLARERAPSVLFIDEIDSLCPAGEQRVSRDKDLTRAVISGIQLLKTATDPVLLIAATSRIEGVSVKLRCSGRFDKELLVPLPNAQQRFQILRNLMLSHVHSVSQEDIAEIAKQAYGFSGADLDLLLKCAWFNCVQKSKEEAGQRAKLCLCKEHLQVGMAGVVPTMLRQDFQAVSMVKWNDIWGYEALKSKLQTMIHLHITEPETYPLKGLLLYGPPGCSKTMFVKALVKETSFSFFPVKCSDLLSKFVGETEKSLSRIFGRAQQAAPSIIFMDEVDSLCGDRGGGSGLVSELLSLMSESAILGKILVIGATNRPHVLDEALLKPGCLEQIIHVDLPDHDCRCEMWKGILEDVPLAGQVSIEKLSDATAGYSGAEITGIYQQAAQAVITQLASRKQDQPQNSDNDNVVMTEDIILNSINSVPARTPVSLLEKIKEFSNNRCSLSAR